MTIEEKCKYVEKYRYLKDEFNGFLFEELFDDIDEAGKRLELHETNQKSSKFCSKFH